jgi:hypothetical protein
MDIQTKFSKCKLHTYLPITLRPILENYYIPDPGYIILLITKLTRGKNNRTGMWRKTNADRNTEEEKERDMSKMEKGNDNRGKKRRGRKKQKEIQTRIKLKKR